jgi:RNA polymerase sigma-70 factor (ECF subfamily)
MADADADLVARIRSGDAAAFETLMRRYFRMAFMIAFAQLGNRADAEDVCQDAFVRCWERIDDCREPARVSGWIAGIVRHMAHNRREYLEVRRSEPLDAADRVASDRADVAAERGELRARLTRALDTLSIVQREVVLLHDLEGWKHAEIAARLDVSEQMSRRHLSDARKRLRTQLANLAHLGVDHD